MAVRKINESTLTAIGNAIRAKTGGSALINPEDMASEIEGIPSGSGDNVVLALPDGYKVVNCVAIPFGGYVNTGVIPTYEYNDYYLDARLDTPVSEITTAAILVGSREASIYAFIGVYSNLNGFVYQLLSTVYAQISEKDNLRHVFQSKSKGTYISVDRTTAVGTESSRNCNNPMLIGARQDQNGTGIERNCALTVWRYTHTKGVSVAIDLIPCQRKSDGQYGFYDLVSESFFGNSGTGTFTEGVE